MKKPLPGQMQKVHVMGQPKEPEDDKPLQWGYAEPLPEPENWDRLQMAQKKKAKEEFNKRWPGGIIPRVR